MSIFLFKLYPFVINNDKQIIILLVMRQRKNHKINSNKQIQTKILKNLYFVFFSINIKLKTLVVNRKGLKFVDSISSFLFMLEVLF